MGNRLTFQDHSEVENEILVDENSVKFFNSLSNIHVNDIVYRVLGIELNHEDLVASDPLIDINDSNKPLSWRDYFSSITYIKEKIEKEKKILEIENFHPACYGYCMDKKEKHIDLINSINEKDKLFVKSKKKGYIASVKSSNIDLDDLVPSYDESNNNEIENNFDPNAPVDEHTDDEESDDEDTLTQDEKIKRVNDNLEYTEDEKEDLVKEIKNDRVDHLTLPEDIPATSITTAIHNNKTSNATISKSTTTAIVKSQDFDSSYINPIYFGYCALKDVIVHAKDMELKVQNSEAEARAITLAKLSRNSVIDSLERSSKNHATARETKINEVEAKYAASKNKREEILARNKKELPSGAFKIFKIEWDNEFKAAEAAYEDEISGLRYIHNTKSSADNQLLMNKRLELEAFNEAEGQELPAAHKLEDIAKVEISRLVNELETANTELDKARAEYNELKNDLINLENKLNKNSNTGGAAAGKKAKNILEDISSIKVVIKDKISAVESKSNAILKLLSQLNDAEILFDKAVSIRKQQDEILPLFNYFLLDEATASSYVPKDSDKNDVDNDNQVTKKKKKLLCRLDLFIASLILNMRANFNQKLNLMLQLFYIRQKNSEIDETENCLYTIDFITKVVMLFQQTLLRLKAIKHVQSEEYIQNYIKRSFLSFGVDPFKYNLTQGLTKYETKQLIHTLVSNSSYLIKLLGINLTSMEKNFSTYQRNKMSPMSLLSHGMITLSDFKYQNHLSIRKYSSKLNPKYMQSIHIVAMAMGEDDPNKTDYSKFLMKIKKSGSKRVTPLSSYHNYYVNVMHNILATKTNAAIKIQAMIRSNKDRKKAELASKRQAFFQAKDMAINEMKNKILNEFKKRETLTGMAKMKWDAQVRMKQAKLSATGQSITRADTVMLMIEEAINKGRVDIETRFKRLESKEDFSGIKFDDDVSKHLLTLQNASNEVDIGKMFGFGKEKTMGETSFLLTDTINTPRPDDNEDNNNGEENEENNAASYDEKAKARATSIIKGYYKYDSKAKGESKYETELRMNMIAPYCNFTDFITRLRSLHKAITEYKAEEIFSEVPSKRLLLKYLMHHSLNEVTTDLITYFKFTSTKYNIEEISAFLMNLLYSDREFGYMLEELKKLQHKVEGGLYILYDNIINQAISDFDTMVKQRMATNETVQPMSIINFELDRMNNYLKKYLLARDETLKEISILKDKYKKIALSCFEIQKRRSFILEYGDRKLKGITNETIVPEEERTSWMKRLANAYDLPEENDDQLMLKYGEIRSVCKSFLDIATNDAVIIINEHMQPKHKKTIQVKDEFIVQGRSKDSGRGLFDVGKICDLYTHTERTKGKEKDKGWGKYYIYEHHNITYQVLEDYHGIFDGNDELASKAYSKERLHSLEYNKLHLPKLNTPLVCCVDFMGYRVLAISSLPVERVIFNDEGEVRKITVEPVYGFVSLNPPPANDSNGNNREDDTIMFANKSKPLMNIFKQAAAKLNLSEHFIKGKADLTPVLTYCSAEVKGYRGLNEQFFVKDFWRAFPSELPETTLHLPRSPREQSIFWRSLRPEYLRRLEIALSPDASNLLVFGQKDFTNNYKNLHDACVNLVDNVIPSFANDLATRNYHVPLSEGLGINIATEMHSYGIGVRHIGLLRSFLWHAIPGHCTLTFSSTSIRTSNDIIDDVKHGDQIYVDLLATSYDDNANNNNNNAAEFNNSTIPTPSSGLLFHVDIHNKKSPLRPYSIPLDKPFLEKTKKNIIVYIGNKNVSRSNIESNENVRSVLLGEMVARTIKSLIKLQLRNYLVKTKCTSYQILTTLIIDYLNVVTGSNDDAGETLRHLIFEGIKEKYGVCACSKSEKSDLVLLLKPVIIYTVKRILAMLGAQLSLTCVSDFMERPYFFNFTMLDLLEVSPVVRHNIPILPYADAVITTCYARKQEKNTYVVSVINDKPLLFFKMSERKGSRTCDNFGTLGNNLIGYYSSGCELEQQGPIMNDPFTKSVAFRPGGKSVMDCKYHPEVVPPKSESHFSLEIWLQCCGGADTVRVALICGRYGIIAGRDNFWTFVFTQGTHDLYIRLAPIDLKAPNRWYHIAASYDGTTLRLYLDSVNLVSLEVEEPFRQKAASFNDSIREKELQIDQDEEAERKTVKTSSQSEAEKYFQSKEGLVALKKSVQSIMETKEFQAQNYGANATSEAEARNEKYQAAMKQAKVQYATDIYLKNVRYIAEKYKQLREDVKDKLKKEEEEGAIKQRKGIRLGSALADGSNKEGKHFFWGNISSLAVYPYCLTYDQISSHYHNAILDRSKDAQRLYSVAASKYEEALLFSSDDVWILKGFAKSLSEFLKIEGSLSSSTGSGTTLSTGKIKIMQAIDQFQSRNIALGIAEILIAIPHSIDYQDIVCKAYNALITVDKYFFTKGTSISRKDLVHIPADFDLDNPINPDEYISTAARIYQEVVRDPSLSFSYGEVDLGWITELNSTQVICALVRSTKDDVNLSMIKIGSMFGTSEKLGGNSKKPVKNRKPITVNDDDVLTLSGNLVLSTGFDLSSCSLLSNSSCSYVTRIRSLSILMLDYIPNIDNKGLKMLCGIGDQLEVLSLQGLGLINDEGLSLLGKSCNTLKVLNVSNCPFITHESITVVCQNSPRMNSIHAGSCTGITDGGMQNIISCLSKKFFTSLDVSFCRDIGDSAILALSEHCPNIKHLTLTSLSKVTDIGMRALLAKCWFIETLLIEDIFLLADNAFYFDRAYDGRPAADENMLKSLTIVNLRDCVNITSKALKGLSLRCKKIENLIIRGCDKLDDNALVELTIPRVEGDNYPLCDSIKSLDISYCASITSSGVLKLLPNCGCLEQIDLSGLVEVDDEFILKLCLVCPTVQRLILKKCVSLTDTALCSLSDYLWIEYLDVTGCTRITDDGIEVLTAVCNGILTLIATGLYKLSDRSLYSVGRNCKLITLLDITGCPEITSEAINDLEKMQINLTVNY